MADRQERYQHYRQFFSPGIARNLRNRNPDSNVQLPPALRDAIPSEYRGNTEDNLRNFRAWSSKYEGFPDSIRRYITDLNRSNGHLSNSSFGYRLFYRMYVLGRRPERDIPDIERRIRDGIGSP